MNSDKKDAIKSTAKSDLIEETTKTVEGAKNWLLDDVELMKAYWHDKMGYMEAWVDANWKTVIEQGKGVVHTLDKVEDAGLLWLIDHVNNNPVPLAECHIAGTEVQPGKYVCLACHYEQTIEEEGTLETCPICHYGIFSNHFDKDTGH